MVVVADASVAIRGDLSGFHKDLKGAERSTATLGEKLKSALTPKNILRGASILGIGLSIRELVGFASDASAQFQDLERATRSVDQIFGDSADTITDWGERAADAAGLSKREVSESAAVMGQMLNNLGFDSSGAADEVIKLQQRAADLAATFGGETSDAIDAVGSLLRGEFDTIEKFGVKIKDADVNARILSLGLDTSTEAAERNAEAVATLSLFYDQTGGASGRFGENLDELSGKLDANQAKIDNWMADVGAGVASVQLDLIEDTEQLGSMTDEVGRFFDGMAMNFGSQHAEILRLADEAGIGFGQMKDQIFAAMDASGQSVDEVIAAMSRAAAGLPPIWTDAMRQSFASWKQMDLGGQTTAIMEPVGDAIAGEVDEGADEAVKRVRQTPGEMAAALEQGREAWRLSWEHMLEAGTDELGKAGRIQDSLAALNSVELTAALKSDDEARQAWALQTRRDLIEALDIDGYNYGRHLVQSFQLGLREHAQSLVDESGAVAAQVRGTWAIESEPKDPNSPFRGVTTWGGNFIKTIAQGMHDEMGSLAPMLDGLHSLPAGTAAEMIRGSTAIGSGAGNTYSPSYTVNLQDRMSVRSVEDIGYGLKRLGRHGILPGSREE